MDVKTQLIREEGRKNSAYQDTLGFWTIGVGRLIDGRKGGGLSDAEVDYLLDNDIAKVKAQIAQKLPWFTALDEPRQAVLIQMAFQMGIDGLMGFTNTLGAVRDQRYPQAAENMRQSLWAKQTPKRAVRLAYQMETGEWN